MRIADYETMLGGMAKRGPKGPMTDEHKAALAMGRNEGTAVRNYLEALRTAKPKRGRRRTRESIAARLAAIDTELETADPMNELRLERHQPSLAVGQALIGGAQFLEPRTKGASHRLERVRELPDLLDGRSPQWCLEVTRRNAR